MNVYMEDQFANKLVGLNTFQLRRMPNFTDASEEQWREWSRRPRINYVEADFVEARMETRRSSPASAASGCRWYGTGPPPRTWTSGPRMRRCSGSRIRLGPDGCSPQEAEAGLAVVVIGWEIGEKLFKGRIPSGRVSRSRAALPGHRTAGQAGNPLRDLARQVAVVPRSSVHRVACRAGFMDEFHVKADNVARCRRRWPRPRKRCGSSGGSSRPRTTTLRCRPRRAPWRVEEDLRHPDDRAPHAGVGEPGGGRHRDHEHHADGGGRADRGDRHPQGAGSQAARHHGPVRGRIRHLSTLGAAIGSPPGSAAFAVRSLTPLPAAVAPWSVLLGVSLGVAVGMIAGIYPASRASKLDPITALRAE